MGNIPVYHHRIPQTYMKPWCFSNLSIWTYDKSTGRSKQRNIENICGANHFHSIKAGSIYTNNTALDRIFGFMKDYKVLLNGECLSTYNERNQNFNDFDHWEIFYPNDKPVNRRDRNKLHQQLLQGADTSIEEKWSTEFENDWCNISHQLYDALRQIQRKDAVALTGYAAETIMKYFVMFEWRGRFGNPTLEHVWDFIFNDVFENGDTVIPPKDRALPFLQTISDEMKHSFLLRTFDKFFNKTGAMYGAYEEYCKQLTFIFLFSDSKKFITSDNPCFTIQNTNGKKEPIFVVLPNLVLSLAKKDPDAPNAYKVATLTDDQVVEYNHAIFENGELILSFDKLK